MDSSTGLFQDFHFFAAVSSTTAIKINCVVQNAIQSQKQSMEQISGGKVQVSRMDGSFTGSPSHWTSNR